MVECTLWGLLLQLYCSNMLKQHLEALVGIYYWGIYGRYLRTTHAGMYGRYLRTTHAGMYGRYLPFGYVWQVSTTWVTFHAQVS